MTHPHTTSNRFNDAPRTPAEAHFGAFATLTLSDAPSQIDRLDRLLLALDKLTHCEAHRRQWIGWILSGRLGYDHPAALERLVTELALQNVEAIQ